MNWDPAGVDRHHQRRRRPNVGDLIAVDRRAWHVARVDDIADTDLSPDDAATLRTYKEAFRERVRPFRILLRRAHGEPHPAENKRGEASITVPVGYHPGFPTYTSDRVPLCSCCGHPWPCLLADQEAWAAKELARAEREMQLMPGCCPACNEPVTSRQRSITFAGPNVKNPLAEGPTFHLRRKCRHGAAAYEELWVADEPGRPRSLLTLKCAGQVITHRDGTAECFGAVDSDCPSVFAQHRQYSSCYTQSHGCPRPECDRSDGHLWGCTPKGYPTDPRAITR
ncbi:hypothetical protein [Nocardioides sp. ChNu-99]|uniref:hypothetical protein n=1 Tax=Nocardioides sp. ChNu-99 TaxID=2839897 RepID=UPI002404B833|nr:hypothetical protein [Nocardioides sp. ChNu-99]MDF9717371.1 hypothetical protein [Nocardioides sp. ChNu-99]